MEHFKRDFRTFFDLKRGEFDTKITISLWILIREMILI
jgi:hypothetical protein